MLNPRKLVGYEDGRLGEYYGNGANSLSTVSMGPSLSDPFSTVNCLVKVMLTGTFYGNRRNSCELT
jgi:hypothetical protein